MTQRFKFPRVPLPRQRGGAHRIRRYPRLRGRMTEVYEELVQLQRDQEAPKCQICGDNFVVGVGDICQDCYER